MRRRGVLSVVFVLVSLCVARQEFPAAQSKPIIPETYYNTFSRAHPVLARIKPGDVVSTRTIDASGRDETGTVRARPSNPLTGPFYVEGAEPLPIAEYYDKLGIDFIDDPGQPRFEIRPDPTPGQARLRAAWLGEREAA